MFQTNKPSINEDNFKEIIQIFKETITDIEFEDNSQEIDLKDHYSPNYACLWNNPTNIDKPCRIVCNDSKMALVIFTHEGKLDNSNLLRNLYRLEDLSLIEELIIN